MKLILHLSIAAFKTVIPKPESSLQGKTKLTKQFLSTHLSPVLLQNCHFIFQKENQDASSAHETK